MKEWNQKGCSVCRRAWETGTKLPEVAVSMERHATLYRCPDCGSYWEEFERFADTITVADVRTYYPSVQDPPPND